MSQITFEDKVPLNNNSSIARRNKVAPEDINEIKRVVNNNDDAMSTKITGTRVYWSTKLEFDLLQGHHALVLMNSNEILICWMSGGGFYYKSLIDETGRATYADNKVTVTRSDGAYFTGTAFIF